MARVTCKGCRTTAKMERAPPGALPEGWLTRSGAAYCTACSADVPVLQLSQRMSEAATAAAIEACLQDATLRSVLDGVRNGSAPYGSPEFIRLVRQAVETACIQGSETLPAAFRSLFNDVLACVSWVQVADRVARSGASASLASDPGRKQDKPTPNGSDPFSL